MDRTPEIVTDAPQIAANDLIAAKNAADVLNRHYPGHLWAVSCDQGMLDVRNMALSGNWGFRVKLPVIYSASEFDRQIMRAGGEILERYRIRRSRKPDNDAISALPVNFAGLHTPAL